MVIFYQVNANAEPFVKMPLRTVFCSTYVRLINEGHVA